MEFIVCSDCACWIANADDSGLDNNPEAEANEIRARRDAAIAEIDGYLVLGDSDNDQTFSHHRCDLCDALPGYRHEAVAIMSDPNERPRRQPRNPSEEHDRRLDRLAARYPGRSEAWYEDGGANDEGWDD